MAAIAGPYAVRPSIAVELEISNACIPGTLLSRSLLPKLVEMQLGHKCTTDAETPAHTEFRIDIPSVVRAAERYFAEVKTERRKSVTTSPTRRRSSNLLPQSEVTAKLRQAERLQRAETRKMSRLSRRDQEPTGALRHTKEMKHVIRSH
jgi:hypothetical protein